MKNSALANSPSKVPQRGVAAVEFALVAIPFFLLLFGAMELGRLLYLWNTVQEVTRHAARQAVVTNFKDPTALAAIKQSAVFRVNAGTLPAAPEISDSNVVIRYLNGAGAVASPMPTDPNDNIAACLDSERVAACIRFVEVCLSTGSTCSPKELIPFQPMIGLFSTSGANSTDFSGIRIPLSTVRMPAESLGYTVP
ncbi:MAG: TadE/TadG family type IV pilus assembly protein [Rhodoferax sp.]|nr:TadE/TadG family type IV pilus assembly protein [Rhodoferax sp.]